MPANGATCGLYNSGQNARPAQGEPPARLDPARELVMKIDAPFTVAAVGDIFGAMAPIVPLEEPRLQSLLKIIRDADLGFANAESSIADLPRFEGPVGGLLAPKAAAADIKAMGIRLAGRANNHTGDNKDDGMFSTDALLDEAGIVHAGTGRNLEEGARCRVWDDAERSRRLGGADADQRQRAGRGQPGAIVRPTGRHIALRHHGRCAATESAPAHDVSDRHRGRVRVAEEDP